MSSVWCGEIRNGVPADVNPPFSALGAEPKKIDRVLDSVGNVKND